MNQYPSISVVIPSFNQGNFIERTLLSIIRQSYPGKVEIIVSDGGSTDNTVNILKKYSDKITHWWSAPDKGFVDAVNKGFSKVTGQICAIQSSDDMYFENAFRKIARAFENNPNVSLVSGAEILINPDGSIKCGLPLLPEINTRTFLLDNWWVGIPQHTTFFKKDMFDKVNGLTYPFNPVSEQDLYYRMIRMSPGIYIDDFIGAYQFHETQMTRVSDKWEKALAFLVEHSYRYEGFNYTLSLDEKKAYEDFIKLFFLDRNKQEVAESYITNINLNSVIPAKTQAIISKYLPINNQKKNNVNNTLSSVIRYLKYGQLTKHLYRFVKPEQKSETQNQFMPETEILPNINWYKY